MRTPDTLFQVDLSTIESLFSQSGRGFYVPPYQRQYSWGREEVDRLVEDLCIGLQGWMDDADSVTFLGSVILIKDELFDQVEPAIKEHLPAEVMVVIDGQQRISTMSILGALLHEEISTRGASIKKKDFPGAPWLINRYEQAIHRLRPLFELNVGFGEAPLYPKIIRAYEDQWSREASSARYKSPVASFLSTYILHYSRLNTTNLAKTAKEKLAGPGANSVDVVVRRFVKQLKKIARGEGTEGEPIFPNEGLLSNASQLHVFKDKLPAEIEAFVFTEQGQQALELLNLIAVANYLLTRCCVSLTRPMEDRFAFELFERLNTTGQQLTAYETFRPLVVKSEGLSNYRDSKSQLWIKEIDSFVPIDMPYERRAKITNDLLLPFAMSQEGKRLAKRLGQQRNWLRNTFEGLPSLSRKRQFVCELRNLARFLNEAFFYKSEVSANSHLKAFCVPEESLVIVCLDYLSRAKNDICVGPLSRFFSFALENPDEQSLRDFADAVKASAAFFTLYRWAFGTSGLPEAYRKLMRIGDPSGGMAPMGQLIKDAKLPSGKEYAKFLGCYLLERLRGVKDDWVKRVKGIPIYDNAVVARFALYSALHDTIADNSIPGLALPQQGKEGSLDLLNLARWSDRPEVEHIAPRTRSSDWPEDLYEGETIDLIGNLILLPKSVNCSANNKSWKQKRLYYSVLGSPSKVSEYLDSSEVAELGIDLTSLTPSTLQLLTNAQYHGYLSLIADVSGEWNSELIQQRSERLAELVWQRLAPWLMLDP